LAPISAPHIHAGLLRMTACVASTCSTMMYVHWRQSRHSPVLVPQKPSHSECYTQSSEPFRFYQPCSSVLKKKAIHMSLEPVDINTWHCVSCLSCLILLAATCHSNSYSVRRSQNAALSYRNGYMDVFSIDGEQYKH
jgi:Fe-S-cluster-containing hydrogenase component 2